MSLDNPAPGVHIAQPEQGFRYGSEPFWLIGFALEGGVPRRALDLGTGSGSAAFLLAGAGVEATGLDRRADWLPLWEKSCAASTVSPTLRVCDILHDPSGLWPLIVSNPPFFPAGTGPVSPNPWKADAKTESTATLADFVRCARSRLVDGGRACFVLPAERVLEIERPTRVVRVGRRRALVEFHHPSRPCGEDIRIPVNDPRVRAWYHRAGGTV